MKLFSLIPDRFFSILTSKNKELYVQALFVLRQAFKTELVIRREDLAAMLMDSLQDDFYRADFSDEAGEENEDAADVSTLSGKAFFLIRKLKTTGWIEIEYESRSFEENITIPDYAISVMNVLYDLSQERVREYNSYVYATYAALSSVTENPDYVYQALSAAYRNTVELVDELKSLFNNIRRYYRRIPGESDVNELLREHFDEYKAKLIDIVYYPLKTIDSVPRFRHPIIRILNEWLLDEEVLKLIVSQGIARKVYKDSEEGHEETLRMISYIADTYDSIEEMIDEIDHRHNQYINASIDHIRYLMNSDRGVKGRLIELLKHAGEEEVLKTMSDSLRVYRHQFYDQRSLYQKVQRREREEGTPLSVEELKDQSELVESFLDGVRRQYTNKKIDEYMSACFAGRRQFSTEEVRCEKTEDFILFLLGTLRGKEKTAFYEVEFLSGNTECSGYSLPRAIFRRKE